MTLCLQLWPFTALFRFCFLKLEPQQCWCIKTFSNSSFVISEETPNRWRIVLICPFFLQATDFILIVKYHFCSSSTSILHFDIYISYSFNDIQYACTISNLHWYHVFNKLQALPKKSWISWHFFQFLKLQYQSIAVYRSFEW